MKGFDSRKAGIGVACGGSGGHFFPGLATAAALEEAGAEPILFLGRGNARRFVGSEANLPFPAVEIPASPFRVRSLRFYADLLQGLRAARKTLRKRKVRAVLATGGFVSPAPVLAARSLGLPVYLHEANAIPGKANLWMASLAKRCFVFFEEATGALGPRRCERAGVPVRPGFGGVSASEARRELGLAETGPVILIAGGSQGAAALNERMLPAARRLLADFPGAQFIHLTGDLWAEKAREAYRAMGARALVAAFFDRMELAAAAADVAVGRAGASFLAELAAVRLPAVLVPLPNLAGNHQERNAEAFARSGAARMVRQQRATPVALYLEVRKLLLSEETRERMKTRLAAWHFPDAGRRIAERVLGDLGEIKCPAPAIVPAR
ncbi:MAG: UDP-N-acetylglucosamine--N-acetylmuramyl-(pentapeptide) pyrophosphoryl-undecaprenol N-acetylglucosamine transferase [Verrucomicrobia bacterium]|nr:UDP-N-acetylglucosamine--N-acetylmuramyl-(pentapeptide) pyrophosphoryl-undecaprenol N-acetylglucosamine transferase [Verrucomicrobiota bacterium]